MPTGGALSGAGGIEHHGEFDGPDALSNLQEYEQTASARETKALLKKLVDALKHVVKESSLKGVDLNDQDQVIEKLVEIFPSKRNGLKFKDAPAQQKEMCKTFADALNKQFTPGATEGKDMFIDTNMSAEVICEAVNTWVNTFASGINTEFFAVQTAVQNAMRNVNVVIEFMRGKKEKMDEVVKSLSHSPETIEFEQASEAYARLDSILKQASSHLENLLKLKLTPTENTIQALLRDTGHTKELVKLFKSGEDRSGKDLSEILGMTIEAAVAANAVVKALATLGIKDRNSYLSMDEAKLTKLLTDKLSVSSEDPAVISASVEVLRDSLGFKQDETFKKTLGVSGGAPTRSAVTLKAKNDALNEARKMILMGFNKASTDKINRINDELYNFTTLLVDELFELEESELLISSYENLKDTNEKIKKSPLDIIKFNLQENPSYTEANSVYESAIRQSELLQSSITNEKINLGLSTFISLLKDMKTTIESFYLSMKNSYSPKKGGNPSEHESAEDMKQLAPIGHSGPNSPEEELRHGNAPPSLMTATQQRLTSDDVVKRFKNSVQVIQFKKNMAHSEKAFTKYGEDYEKVLGVAMSKYLEDKKKQYKVIYDRVQRIKDQDSSVPNANKYKQTLKDFLENSWDVEKRMNDTLQSIELYLKSFTVELIKNPDELRDLYYAISGAKVIHDLFSNLKGFNLGKFYYWSGELQGPVDGSWSVDDLLKPFNDLYSEFPKVMSEIANFQKNFEVIKNIVILFSNIGDKFSGKSVYSENFMSPRQMFKNLTDYFRYSLFQIHESDFFDLSAPDAKANPLIETEVKPATSTDTFIRISLNSSTKEERGKINAMGPAKDPVAAKAYFKEVVSGILDNYRIGLNDKEEKDINTLIDNIAALSATGGDYHLDLKKLITTLDKDNKKIKITVPSGAVAVDSTLNSYSCRNDLVMDAIDAMLGKILMVTNVSKIFTGKLNFDDSGDEEVFIRTKTIVGGGNATVIPDAAPLYFRLIRIIEYYNILSEEYKTKISNLPAGSTLKNKKSVYLIPSDGNIFMRLFAYISKEDVRAKKGDYNDQDINFIIEEVNVIYQHYHNIDPDNCIKLAMRELIDYINVCFGLYSKNLISEREQTVKVSDVDGFDQGIDFDDLLPGDDFMSPDRWSPSTKWYQPYNTPTSITKSGPDLSETRTTLNEYKDIISIFIDTNAELLLSRSSDKFGVFIKDATAGMKKITDTQQKWEFAKNLITNGDFTPDPGSSSIEKHTVYFGLQVIENLVRYFVDFFRKIIMAYANSDVPKVNKNVDKLIDNCVNLLKKRNIRLNYSNADTLNTYSSTTKTKAAANSIKKANDLLKDIEKKAETSKLELDRLGAEIAEMDDGDRKTSKMKKQKELIVKYAALDNKKTEMEASITLAGTEEEEVKRLEDAGDDKGGTDSYGKFLAHIKNVEDLFYDRDPSAGVKDESDTEDDQVEDVPDADDDDDTFDTLGAIDKIKNLSDKSMDLKDLFDLLVIDIEGFNVANDKTLDLYLDDKQLNLLSNFYDVPAERLKNLYEMSSYCQKNLFEVLNHVAASQECDLIKTSISHRGEISFDISKFIEKLGKSIDLLKKLMKNENDYVKNELKSATSLHTWLNSLYNPTTTEDTGSVKSKIENGLRNAFNGLFDKNILSTNNLARFIYPFNYVSETFKTPTSSIREGLKYIKVFFDPHASSNFAENDFSNTPLLLELNLLVEMILSTSSHSGLKKIYGPAIENYAYGTASMAIDSPLKFGFINEYSNSQGILKDYTGKKGIYPLLKDPRVLFTSSAYKIQSYLYTELKGVKVNKFETLSEVPAHIKENMRTYFPIIIKRLNSLKNKCHTLRKLFNRNIKDDFTHGSKYFEVGIFIENKETLHICRDREATPVLKQYLDLIPEHCDSLIMGLSDTLIELGDAPKFMELYTDMFEKYSLRNPGFKPPILPSVLPALCSIRNSHHLNFYPIGSDEFKLKRGFSSLIVHGVSQENLDSMTGILTDHNSKSTFDKRYDEIAFRNLLEFGSEIYKDFATMSLSYSYDSRSLMNEKVVTRIDFSPEEFHSQVDVKKELPISVGVQLLHLHSCSNINFGTGPLTPLKDMIEVVKASSFSEISNIKYYETKNPTEIPQFSIFRKDNDPGLATCSQENIVFSKSIAEELAENKYLIIRDIIGRLDKGLIDDKKLDGDFFTGEQPNRIEIREDGIKHLNTLWMIYIKIRLIQQMDPKFKKSEMAENLKNLKHLINIEVKYMNEKNNLRVASKLWFRYFLTSMSPGLTKSFYDKTLGYGKEGLQIYKAIDKEIPSPTPGVKVTVDHVLLYKQDAYFKNLRDNYSRYSYNLKEITASTALYQLSKDDYTKLMEEETFTTSSLAKPGDRNNQVIQNMLDIRISPVHYQVLMKDVPLVNIFTYSDFFIRIMGISESKIGFTDTKATDKANENLPTEYSHLSVFNKYEKTKKYIEHSLKTIEDGNVRKFSALTY